MKYAHNAVRGFGESDAPGLSGALDKQVWVAITMTLTLGAFSFMARYCTISFCSRSATLPAIWGSQAFWHLARKDSPLAGPMA